MQEVQENFKRAQKEWFEEKQRLLSQMRGSRTEADKECERLQEEINKLNKLLEETRGKADRKSQEADSALKERDTEIDQLRRLLESERENSKQQAEDIEKRELSYQEEIDRLQSELFTRTQRQVSVLTAFKGSIVGLQSEAKAVQDYNEANSLSLSNLKQQMEGVRDEASSRHGKWFNQIKTSMLTLLDAVGAARAEAAKKGEELTQSEARFEEARREVR